MTATEQFVENSRAYGQKFDKGALPMPPGKKTAIVTCMDARIETGRLLGLREGDAHVIRNAGGVITDDVMRSLVISQRLQGTDEIMIIHHTNCGLLTLSERDFTAEIEADTGVRPPFGFHAFTDLEQSVRRSIKRLQASPFLPRKEQIRGFIYDVRTARLAEVIPV